MAITPEGARAFLNAINTGLVQPRLAERERQIAAAERTRQLQEQADIERQLAAEQAAASYRQEKALTSMDIQARQQAAAQEAARREAENLAARSLDKASLEQGAERNRLSREEAEALQQYRESMLEAQRRTDETTRENARTRFLAELQSAATEYPTQESWSGALAAYRQQLQAFGIPEEQARNLWAPAETTPIGPQDLRWAQAILSDPNAGEEYRTAAQGILRYYSTRGLGRSGPSNGPNRIGPHGELPAPTSFDLSTQAIQRLNDLAQWADNLGRSRAIVESGNPEAMKGIARNYGIPVTDINAGNYQSALLSAINQEEQEYRRAVRAWEMDTGVSFDVAAGTLYRGQ